METRCLIIDDEPIAIEIVESYLKKIPNFKIVAKLENAIQALEVVQKENIHLIFLDIQLPEFTGLEFMKSLSNPPKVIFITAYRDYAVEGFELDAIDYLVKPISFDRFLKAINKYYKSTSQELPSTENIVQDTDDYIFVNENRKMVKIYLSEILIIESIKDYVKIITPSKTIITKQQLSYFEESLPQNMFLRIHRSILVATNKIEAYTANIVEIQSIEYPIGISYKNSVSQTLNALKKS